MVYDPTTVDDLSLATPVSDYMQANLPLVTGFISSGAATPQFANLAQMGGNYFTLRRWKTDLTASVLDDGSVDDGVSLDSSSEIARITRRRRSRPVDNGTRSALGSADSEGVMNELKRQSVYYWANDMDVTMSNVLVGLIDAATGALKDTHVNFFGNASGTVKAASFNALVDTAKKGGVNMEAYSMMIVQSRVWADLKKEAGAKIDYPFITDASGAFITNEQGQPVRATYYDGKRVIFDDTFPVSGTGTYAKYRTILVKPGALAYAIQRDVETKIGYVPERNTEWLVQAVAYAPHVMGVSFTGTPASTKAGPTNAEFATPGNWTKTGTDREIGIAVLESNASA